MLNQHVTLGQLILLVTAALAANLPGIAFAVASIR
jgi:hypothetical protein